MTADVLVAPVSDAAAADLPSWRLVLRRPAFIIGAVILLFWIVCALFGSSIAPHDPHAQQLLFANNAPSGKYWFGTDQLGRDVFSRVIGGSRSILVIAAAGRSTAWPAERGCFGRSTLTVCWRKWHAPHAAPAAQG